MYLIGQKLYPLSLFTLIMKSFICQFKNVCGAYGLKKLFQRVLEQKTHEPRDPFHATAYYLTFSTSCSVSFVLGQIQVTQCPT